MNVIEVSKWNPLLLIIWYAIILLFNKNYFSKNFFLGSIIKLNLNMFLCRYLRGWSRTWSGMNMAVIPDQVMAYIILTAANQMKETAAPFIVTRNLTGSLDIFTNWPAYQFDVIPINTSRGTVNTSPPYKNDR